MQVWRYFVVSETSSFGGVGEKTSVLAAKEKKKSEESKKKR